MRRLPRPLLACFLLLGCWLTPREAGAHIELLDPPQRYPAANQFDIPLKSAPCGDPANPPGTVPRTVLQPGATITVRWQAFVPHPGHFRIAFDPDGDDDLGGPGGYDDLYTPGTEVLLDGIPVMGNQQSYEAQVALPDVTCTNCTLQLIQVMTDKMPWGPGGGSDLYYQCADIILDPDGGPGSTSGPGSGTGGSGSGSGGSTSTATGTSTGSSASGTGATSAASAGTSGPDGTGDTSGGGSGSSGCRAAGHAPAGALCWLLLAAARRRSKQHA